VLGLWDSLFCQLFHGAFVEVVSYSRQGAYRCGKAGCRAEQAHERRQPLRAAPTAQSVAPAPQPQVAAQRAERSPAPSLAAD
jgi:hypothetical protein